MADSPTAPRTTTSIGVKQHSAEIIVPMSPTFKSLELFIKRLLRPFQKIDNALDIRHTARRIIDTATNAVAFGLTRYVDPID